MRILSLALFAMLVLALLPYSSAASQADIEVRSDLQILDVMDVFGGHITWVIHGEYARELRQAIGEKYGVTSIDLGTASKYFKGDLERVIENNLYGCGYLGFVRVTRADPLHDDTQGILNDEHDVEGLVGDVNSDAPITLRMLIRGHPVDGRHFVTTQNLSFAPFYALVTNASDISRFNLTNARISIEHREIIAGLGSFRIPEGTFTLRLIVGEFFMSSGGWVEYHSFDPINSPIVLFVVYIVAIYVLSWFHTALRGDKGDTLMEKKARRFTTAMKIVLLLIYLVLPLSGIYYMVIIGVAVAASYPVVRKLYGS